MNSLTDICLAVGLHVEDGTEYKVRGLRLVIYLFT